MPIQLFPQKYSHLVQVIAKITVCFLKPICEENIVEELGIINSRGKKVLRARKEYVYIWSE